MTRPKEPFKTRKVKTVPIAAQSSPPSAPPPSQSKSPSVPKVHPSHPSIYGPPSSDASWVAEQMTADRTTERSLTVPTSEKKDRATLTVITGFNAGQVFALDGTEHTIGRGTEADIWVEDGGVSRLHAKILCNSDGKYVVHDLGSTNGTFVGPQRITSSELKPGDRVQLGPSVIFRFAIIDDAEEELQRRLYESSTRDALTRIYNRKYFMERLFAEVAYCRRHKVKLSVLMMDIDEFKTLNDTYGHLAGDMVLRLVAAQLARLIRVEDLLARYGGEEFVVLARSTGRTEATRLAERIRADVESLVLPLEDEGTTAPRVTVSVGVASLADAGPEAGPNDLLARADARLYRAKDGGRNRVCSEDPSADEKTDKANRDEKEDKK